MSSFRDSFVLRSRRKSKTKMDRDTHFAMEKKKFHDNHESKKQTDDKPKRRALVSFSELPEYMKDNEFIQKYYRANWPLKEALFSVFRWHNETLNVWTHLIGFILFLGLTMANLIQVPQIADLISLITRSFPISAYANVSHNSEDFILQGTTTNLIDLKQVTPSEMDIAPPLTPVTRWPFFVFLAGSMFCLLSSTICHLFSCHSHKLNLQLLRIDYTGITVMIITSFFPPIYYIFQCDSHWHFIYLGGITAMGIFTVFTLLSPTLSTGKFRAFRALLFSSMGFFGIVPAIHGSFVNWDNPKRNVTLAYESAMGLFYVSGTVFYVTRVPERWKPGWFDLAGHSHQIFHVLVVLGALAHYGATLVFLEWRDRVGCSNIIV
ncbi:hypothetical protein JRO89_XS03G0287900 [Xanthoceras sorbifolium]|uniref:Heptahelical transmembrane protein 1-like n=1 Tax=Xanthoceras sorbifolium TaxID=99658 RepID=A0ABQ8ID16_9ROSI|nr:hypothetical protein JRO89_XS03G0287900 [Xanthoceras sorbifolium]